MQENLSDSQLKAIRLVDTCTLTDAIATLKVRLRNQGYSNGCIRCIFENPVPMVGYAVTGRIRSAEPPVMGRRFVERSDWLKYITTLPEPRVVVLQDVDHTPGNGAFWDEVHARIHLRLGCVGAITNGAVRDLPRIQPMGFYLYAGNVSAAQSYAHIIDMGEPVEVGGLAINPGDLIHGDTHGFVLVPREVVQELPEAAARVLRIRQRIAELCSSPGFSIEKLKGLLTELE
jgi:4-hydroxy-4-methyl-2-oxoglutarate aldolase